MANLAEKGKLSQKRPTYPKKANSVKNSQLCPKQLSNFAEDDKQRVTKTEGILQRMTKTEEFSW
jgi:hypothetical protein